MIDPDRPRFKAPALLAATGITRDAYAKRKADLGLYRGDGVRAAPKYSITDIAVATAIETLLSLGGAFNIEAAAQWAELWRKPLSETLWFRLNYGFWDRAVAVLNDRGFSIKLSLDTICEAVIVSMGLPLPLVDRVPSKKLAFYIVRKVSGYIDTPEHLAKCAAFKKEVIARGTPTDWREVSIRLAIPFWILREGHKAIVEDMAEAAEAADSDTPPISVVALLRDQLGVNIVGGLL